MLNLPSQDGSREAICWSPNPVLVRGTSSVGGTDLGVAARLNELRLQAEAAGVVGDDRLVMPKQSKE